MDESLEKQLYDFLYRYGLIQTDLNEEQTLGLLRSALYSLRDGEEVLTGFVAKTLTASGLDLSKAFLLTSDGRILLSRNANERSTIINSKNVKSLKFDELSPTQLTLATKENSLILTAKDSEGLESIGLALYTGLSEALPPEEVIAIFNLAPASAASEETATEGTGLNGSAPAVEFKDLTGASFSEVLEEIFRLRSAEIIQSQLRISPFLSDLAPKLRQERDITRVMERNGILRSLINSASFADDDQYRELEISFSTLIDRNDVDPEKALEQLISFGKVLGFSSESVTRFAKKHNPRVPGLPEQNPVYSVTAQESEAALSKGNAFYNSNDLVTAEYWYKIAASRDNAEALIRLGYIYEFDKKNLYQAEQYYLKAASLNNVEAMSRLGSLYEDMKEFNLSTEWRVRAAYAGDGYSTYALGKYYSNKGEYQRALDMYKIASDYKFVNVFETTYVINAMCGLIAVYFKLKDYAQVEAWCEKTVSKLVTAETDDDIISGIMLMWGNEYYENGEYGKARKWFNESAIRGNRLAKARMRELVKWV